MNNPPPDWLDGLALTSNTPTVVQGPMVNGETKDVTIGLVNSLDISVTRPLSPFRSNAIIRGYADASGVDLLQTESVEIQLHVRRPPYIWLDATRAGEAGWVSDSLSESSHVPLELFDELLQKPGHVSDSIECRIYNGINAVGYISEWPLNYEIPIWTKTHPGGAILPVTDLRVSLPDYPLQPLPGSNYSYGTVPAGVPYANFDRVRVEMFKMFELSIPYSTVLNPYYEIPYIEARDTENRTPTQHLHICVQRFPACTDTLKVDMVFTSYDPNHHFLMTANWIDVGCCIINFANYGKRKSNNLQI